MAEQTEKHASVSEAKVITEDHSVIGAHSIISDYSRLIKGLIIASAIIFIFLPSIIMLASDVFPTVIPGAAASKSLTDGVNKIIAFISVILGLISIHLAKQTDKVFAEQKVQQNTFMEHIEGYTRNMSQSIDRMLYDIAKDKEGTKIQNPSEANEDDSKSHNNSQ